MRTAFGVVLRPRLTVGRAADNGESETVLDEEPKAVDEVAAILRALMGGEGVTGVAFAAEGDGHDQEATALREALRDLGEIAFIPAATARAAGAPTAVGAALWLLNRGSSEANVIAPPLLPATPTGPQVSSTDGGPTMQDFGEGRSMQDFGEGEAMSDFSRPAEMSDFGEGNSMSDFGDGSQMGDFGRKPDSDVPQAPTAQPVSVAPPPVAPPPSPLPEVKRFPKVQVALAAAVAVVVVAVAAVVVSASGEDEGDGADVATSATTTAGTEAPARNLFVGTSNYVISFTVTESNAAEGESHGVGYKGSGSFRLVCDEDQECWTVFAEAVGGAADAPLPLNHSTFVEQSGVDFRGRSTFDHEIAECDGIRINGIEGVTETPTIEGTAFIGHEPESCTVDGEVRKGRVLTFEFTGELINQEGGVLLDRPRTK